MTSACTHSRLERRERCCRLIDPEDFPDDEPVPPRHETPESAEAALAFLARALQEVGVGITKSVQRQWKKGPADQIQIGTIVESSGRSSMVASH